MEVFYLSTPGSGTLFFLDVFVGSTVTVKTNVCEDHSDDAQMDVPENSARKDLYGICRFLFPPRDIASAIG